MQQGAEFGVARLCGGIDQQDHRDGNVACGGFAERGVERIELFGVEIVGFAAVGVFDMPAFAGDRYMNCNGLTLTVALVMPRSSRSLV